jgi:RHS repeat-associated protein
VFRPSTFEPLAIAAESVHYYETGASGLPHAVLREDGSAIWRGRFDALGQLVDAPVNEVEQPLRLQGQYFDSETDLAYNRFRYYDGHTGSFVSQDPLGQRAGPNPYSYADNVWGWVDVFGLSCTVYRVEGVGNARVHIDGKGNVTIPNKDAYLYLSFRDQAHADYFLAKKRAEFPDSTIKAFDVPDDVVKEIQDKAVKQRDAAKFPGAPQISDPTVAKKLGMDPKDVLGVTGSDIAKLEENAIPGSGRTL